MTPKIRHTPFLIAAIMPLLVFAWFLPKGAVQVDLWLLWLLAMGVLGLPMMFLELALSYRSGRSPLQGMQELTRQADVKTHWRVFSFLSVFLSVLLAVGFIVRFAERLVASLVAMDVATIPSYALAFALTIVALFLIPLKHRLLGIGAVLIVVSAVLSVVLGDWQGIAMTDTSFGEWARAVIMALFSVGVGTGLYWFLDERTGTKALTGKVLPIWFFQIVFGAIAFGITGSAYLLPATIVGLVGVLMVAGFLLSYAQSQLTARFGMVVGIAITVLIAILMSALPSGVLGSMMVVAGLLSALVLSVFAGFVMKLSHLRKSLNFKTEARYNLWRILVRWIIPLAILSALVGWFIG